MDVKLRTLHGTHLRQDPSPETGASDKGKPGESRRRKATELQRVDRPVMSAGQPNYPDGGEMFSSTRTMLINLLACVLISGCSGDAMDPGSAEALSASVSKLRAVSGPVSLSARDSLLEIGDTVTVLAVARNTRTDRDVSREVRFTFGSSDTSVATVDRRGLVTARATGTARITVRSSLGSARVRVSVGVQQTVTASDTVKIFSAPDVPPVDTQTRAPDAGRLAPPADLGAVLPPLATPMLPAANVNTALPTLTGRTIRVPAGNAAALQAALNSAVGGDEIVLPDNSIYVGSFTLPKHTGREPIILRSETVPVQFGTRITPATGASLARLVSTSVFAALATEDAAANWRVIAVRFVHRAGTDNYGIVKIGNGTESAIDQLVSNIILDRVIVDGEAEGSASRCVSMNGNSIAVIESWLMECHAKGRDTQGILGWTGMGPFLIANNHIEGAGQNVMFGGSDPRITGLTPSDITIRGNHFYKPMSWAGGKWTVKAAFELKHARRVLFEGNVIENHWIDAQVGYAVMITSANQDGSAPWTKVQDITLQNNLIRNSTAGVNVLSRYTNAGHTQDEPSRRILLRNNLFVNVGRDPVTNAVGRYIQLAGDHEDVSFVQNTFFGAGAINAILFDGAPSKRLTLFNNLFSSSEYGVFGSGSSEGIASLAQFAPGSRVEGNAFTSRTARFYPAGNSFPATLSSSDFTNAAGGDYTLRSTLPYSMSGGTIVGVDGQAIANAIRRSTAP